MDTKQPYELLEEQYAIFTGSKHAVSCNSGTSALHLALLALGIKPGDEVIIPDFTMAAVAFAVSYCGAIPVFADVDRESYFILPSEVARLRTNKTRAIIAVHTYGRVGNIRSIIGAGGGLPVIEDACEAQGAVYKSEANITCYSFYRNKIIHAEEGGICTTDNKEYADKMRYYKNMAFNKAHDYFHEHIGYNYRMPNSQALQAIESLNLYKQNNEKRRNIEGWYDMLITPKKKKRDAVWFYDIEGDQSAVDRIPGARLPFKPLSSFPMYRKPVGKNSQYLSENLLLLPCNVELTQDDIRRIYTLL